MNKFKFPINITSFILIIASFILGAFFSDKIPYIKNSERKKLETEIQILERKNSTLENEKKKLILENEKTLIYIKEEVDRVLDSIENVSNENDKRIKEINNKYEKINRIDNFDDAELVNFFSKFKTNTKADTN